MSGDEQLQSTLPVETMKLDDEPFEAPKEDDPPTEVLTDDLSQDMKQDMKENERKRPQRKDQQRKLKIQRCEERRGGFSKYNVYIVACDPPPKGVVTVARRYSDFLWLRNCLTKAFPALWIPPLPPKKMFNRFDIDFVESRRKDLERFLNRLEAIAPLAQSKQMIMFLSRPETTFKSGCQEIEEAMREDTNATRIYLFQTLFPDLHENNLSATAALDLTRLSEFLVKCREQLEALLESCKNSLSKYDQSSEEVKQLSQVFTELIQTERNYPYRPNPDRYDIRNQLNKWEAFTRQQTDSFEDKFLHTVQYEYQDVVAFLELIERRDLLEAQFTKLNTKCENWRGTGDSDLNPKQKAAKDTDLKEEKELQDYLEIFNKIVLENEITKVWDEKIETFERNVLEFSDMQLGQTKHMSKIWNEAVPNIAT